MSVIPATCRWRPKAHLARSRRAVKARKYRRQSRIASRSPGPAHPLCRKKAPDPIGSPPWAALGCGTSFQALSLCATCHPMRTDRLLAQLNSAQRRAVMTDSGPLLVLAGAGTGKTRVVTYRIARLIAKGTPPARILAVTFTNKAAGEMQQRVRSLLGRATEETPEISTFHSLCVRILRRQIDKLGYPEAFRDLRSRRPGESGPSCLARNQCADGPIAAERPAVPNQPVEESGRAGRAGLDLGRDRSGTPGSHRLSPLSARAASSPGRWISTTCCY